MKLCLSCWIERENAFQLVDELKSEIKQLLSGKPRTPRGENKKLKARVAELEVENMRLRMTAGSRQTATGAIPNDVIRLLIQLAHPDRHGGSQASQKATQWLLSQKGKSR